MVEGGGEWGIRIAWWEQRRVRMVKGRREEGNEGKDRDVEAWVEMPGEVSWLVEWKSEVMERIKGGG